MWAQQWRYISIAMEAGYRVLRSDTDVYLAEDPYPILRGPLFSRFEMICQHDFFGARERPHCDVSPRKDGSSDGALLSCGTRPPHLALLNIGLVYLRSSPGGGVFAVINGTWARFYDRLSGPPSKPPHLGGKVDSQALIDQPFMRAVVNELAVPDAHFFPHKSADRWAVLPGSTQAIYTEGQACALESPSLCARVAAERSKTAFLVQSVRPHRRPGIDANELRDERVALAPDWLFGRGCLTHLREPIKLLKQAHSPAVDAGQCTTMPTRLGAAPLAPGPAAGLLVATHFVYSMALKRKRAFRAFGWDLADGRNRTADASGSCFSRSSQGILFGHTFFDQTTTMKSIVCSLPLGDGPACSCCAGLGSMQATEVGRGGYRLETTSGAQFNNPGLFKALEGCNDYQVLTVLKPKTSDPIPDGSHLAKHAYPYAHAHIPHHGPCI